MMGSTDEVSTWIRCNLPQSMGQEMRSPKGMFNIDSSAVVVLSVHANNL